jgi:hypothetical protein
MASSGTLRRGALVRTEVAEELWASFIRVTRIGELGTTLAVTSNRRTLRRNTKWQRKLVWNSELRMQRGVGVAGILNSEFDTSFLSHFVFLRSVGRLLVTTSVAPSSPILVTLMKGVLSSSETSILIRATRHKIPEDAMLHSHRSENLKSYFVLNLC